jgi:WD40 repeat protein
MKEVTVRLAFIAASILVLAGLSVAAPVQWPTEVGGNGHWYEAVYVPYGTTWDEANAAATVSGGHLATITSAAENEFVFQLADTSDTLWSMNQYGIQIGPWLGGWQPEGAAEPDGGWRWVTDEPFSYTNWLPGEPNDNWEYAGQSWPEDSILFWDRSSGWNDYANVDPVVGVDQPVAAYIVEYVPEPAAQFLFVGDDTNNNGMIRQYDAQTGAFLGNFATLPNPMTGGMAYGPDGDLFVVNRDVPLIQRLNPITGAVIHTYDPGAPATSLAFAPDGSLLVTSYSDSNVRRVDLGTGTSTLFAELIEANGITVAGNGDVYVTSFGEGSVTRFSAAGAYLGSAFVGGLGYGIQCGPDGFLYVAVESADQVLRINSTTLASSTYISAGLGGLNSPRDVSFGYDGNLYVVSGLNQSVKKYNGSTGAYIGDFVPSGSGGLTDPHFLVFGPTPTALPGDFNVDGSVDAADYVVWGKNQGTQAQYDQWRANFGRTVGSGTIAAGVGAGAGVPEPSTLALFAIPALLGCLRRCINIRRPT